MTNAAKAYCGFLSMKERGTPVNKFNKLFTNLHYFDHTGEIGPCSFLYRPHCTGSVLPQLWVNIPQYSPKAWLDRS